MKLGKYELHEQLGRGGFGTVYRATDTVLEVERALKVLHPALVADDTFIARFRQEARFAARLEHPNLVPVYDFGEADGRYYLAMRFMPGGSLKELLTREGRLEQARALEIMRQIARGIGYAHDQGIIHRDLKPGNILFEQDGTARVSDMGFAKALAGGSSASLSATGGMIGTPSYMAPELWRAKPAVPASDIYSMGCILYEMLTGEVLFEGESPADVMTKHVLDGPQMTTDLPVGTAALISKALEKDPEKRYADTREFLAAVEALDSQPQAVEAKIETILESFADFENVTGVSDAVIPEEKLEDPGVMGVSDALIPEDEIREETVVPAKTAPNPEPEAERPGTLKYVSPYRDTRQTNPPNTKPSRVGLWVVLGLIVFPGFLVILATAINNANRRSAVVYPTSTPEIFATETAYAVSAATQNARIHITQTAVAPQPSHETITPKVSILTVKSCKDPKKDCPAAVPVAQFYKGEPRNDYSFDIPSDTELYIYTGWEAIDIATLEENLPYVEFFLEIDGEDYYSDSLLSIKENPDADDPTKMNGVLNFGAVISGLVPHQPHTIYYGYKLNAQLSDGWDDYDSGLVTEKTLHICPDGGCSSSFYEQTPESESTSTPAPQGNQGSCTINIDDIEFGANNLNKYTYNYKVLWYTAELTSILINNSIWPSDLYSLAISVNEEFDFGCDFVDSSCSVSEEDPTRLICKVKLRNGGNTSGFQYCTYNITFVSDTCGELFSFPYTVDFYN